MNASEARAELWDELSSCIQRYDLPMETHGFLVGILNRLSSDGDLGRALCPEGIEGWAMPEKDYYVRPGGKSFLSPGIYERQIRVYLDRAPKGSRRVRIVGEEGTR